MHVGVLLGNTPGDAAVDGGRGLGGYVLCGINTTRRGAAWPPTSRRADCQIVLADAEHLPLLDGLDLGGRPGGRRVQRGLGAHARRRR